MTQDKRMTFPNPMLVVVSGPSGVGKSTIVAELARLGHQKVAAQLDGTGNRQRSVEGRAFDELHDGIVRADVVELADVWMVELTDRSGLALEALRELLVGGLDGDNPVEPGISRAITLRTLRSSSIRLLFV